MFRFIKMRLTGWYVLMLALLLISLISSWEVNAEIFTRHYVPSSRVPIQNTSCKNSEVDHGFISFHKLICAKRDIPILRHNILEKVSEKCPYMENSILHVYFMFDHYASTHEFQLLSSYNIMHIKSVQVAFSVSNSEKVKQCIAQF